MSRPKLKLPPWVSGRLKHGDIRRLDAILTIGCKQCNFHRVVDIDALIERDSIWGSMFNRGADCPHGCAKGCAFYISQGRGAFVRPFYDTSLHFDLLRVQLPADVLHPPKGSVSQAAIREGGSFTRVRGLDFKVRSS